MAPSPASHVSFRVEVRLRPDQPDARGRAARAELRDAGLDVAEVRSVRGFALALPGPADDAARAAERIATEVLCDPIVETYHLLADDEPPPTEDGTDHRVDVAKKAGVMDPAADGVVRAVRAAGLPLVAARTYSAWLVRGDVDADSLAAAAARALGNEAIEEISADGDRVVHAVMTPDEPPFERTTVPLPDDDEALAAVSDDGGLSLSPEEMRTIRAHFRELGRDPTDVELETIAQTWSEHCKHKTLAGAVEIDGRRYENMLKETIFAATRELALPWCVSVFVDNAGVVAFDDEYHVTFKVETHNHPSAIEPYGGAGTGIGGVLRDTMGTGLGARPIVSTDVFCFGPPDLPRDRVPAGALHPLRVLKGVVAGVRDYGNRMGIPTANGAVVFDERYTGNPLVHCGSVGLLPADKVEKAARPGDLVVVAGGRTGRDGIHGATFSSRELHSESETLDSGAVQIGNAITEKRVLDAMLQARDRGLYSCVTDCGAGGLSSAVGEMAERCGAEVDLETVPLKYAGLTYPEIWISEAQERMVFSVPPEHEAELLALFASEDVEATVIGRFTDSGRLVLRFRGEEVGDLDLGFLHDGVPKVTRRATVRVPSAAEPALDAPDDLGAALHRVLAHPDVASKEWIVRQYDHEVQAGSVVKPFAGDGERSPTDAAVVKPRLDSYAGVAISNGIAPRTGEIDPYAMGLLAIDEAFRNVIAVGARADRVALLDNFCAGNCERPEILGDVTRVAEACRDAALALKAPFVSGKDSLNNEYRTEHGTAAIPTTILISAIAHVDDVRRAVTSPLKGEESRLVLVGATRAELGGSTWYALHGELGRSVPRVDLDVSRRTFAAMSGLARDGLLRACHDLSDGGLAVAAAEMTFGAAVGASLDLAAVPRADGPEGPDVARDDVLLFSESPTRFLCEVAPEDLARVTKALGDVPHAVVGETIPERRLRVRGLGGDVVIDQAADALHETFRAALDFGSPAEDPSRTTGPEGSR